MSMPLFAASTADAQFTADVRAGLTAPGQKWIPSTYLYDEIGSALFEVITLLPEYGLTRADTRVIARCAPELREHVPDVCCVVELGSGSGKKTRRILETLGSPAYHPVDVSRSALDQCARELASVAPVYPVEASYLEGLRSVRVDRGQGGPLLVLFLGSTIGNFGHREAVGFLSDLHRILQRGDVLLLGADLVKPVEDMLVAYDDPAGVTAAFNLNLLGRINRELGGSFDLRLFSHEARWNASARAIEMHLRSSRDQRVRIEGAGCSVRLKAGETIWTESSHKYDLEALRDMARVAGFTPVRTWTDTEWPFAECLWQA